MSTKNSRKPAGKRASDGRFVKGSSAEVGRPFQPGQSGNPGGRPKGLRAEIRSRVGEDGEVIVNELVTILTSRSRARDRVMAAKELLDRAFGRVALEMKHSGEILVTDERMRKLVDEDDRHNRLLKAATNEELDLMEEHAAVIDEVFKSIEARTKGAEA